MQATVSMPIRISKMCVACLLGYLFNVHTQYWQPNDIYDVRFHIWSRQWYMVINAGRLFRDDQERTFHKDDEYDVLLVMVISTSFRRGYCLVRSWA